MHDRRPVPSAAPGPPAEQPANRAARRARGKGRRPVLPPTAAPVPTGRTVRGRGTKNYAVRHGG